MTERVQCVLFYVFDIDCMSKCDSCCIGGLSSVLVSMPDFLTNLWQVCWHIFHAEHQIAEILSYDLLLYCRKVCIMATVEKGLHYGYNRLT